MNANEEAVTTLEQTHSRQLSQWTRAVLTAGCSVALTLAIWVLLVSLLDRPLRGYDSLVWSGTLWFSAMLSTGIVACFRYEPRCELTCTIAFAVFGLAYMVCEGPIFGVVSEGGDPDLTEFVVVNLALLPAGVYAAALCGLCLRRHRRNNRGKEEPAQG